MPLKTPHMDVTIFKPMDNTKVYIYLLVDNFSRYIIGWKASLQFSSKIALEVLKESIAKHNINPDGDRDGSQLIVDDGSENKGKVSEYLETNYNIVKLVAQKDIIQSNSMVEADNKHIKYYYLFTKELPDFSATVNYLERSIPDYNNKPHGKLLDLTPDEV